jgi:ketosteroid isomerase-like protein
MLPDGLNPITHIMIAKGDCIAFKRHSNATLPDGGRCQNDYHRLFELSESKVILAREYPDTLLMKQVTESMAEKQ